MTNPPTGGRRTGGSAKAKQRPKVRVVRHRRTAASGRKSAVKAHPRATTGNAKAKQPARKQRNRKQSRKSLLQPKRAKANLRKGVRQQRKGNTGKAFMLVGAAGAEGVLFVVFQSSFWIVAGVVTIIVAAAVMIAGGKR